MTTATASLAREVRHSPLLWLLAFVPVVLVAEHLAPDAHTLLFVLSVLAIVPLAAVLSHATESVAAKTGDTVGGLLNATLGNLTELVIALAALGAGQYMLVKASIAGAIVTNTLFMLGTSFLLGGVKHHVQEFNRASARLQAALLFLATVALLVPSAVAQVDSAPATGAVGGSRYSVIAKTRYTMSVSTPMNHAERPRFVTGVAVIGAMNIMTTAPGQNCRSIGAGPIK